MSGYTVVNLKEVEDQAPRFGYAPHLRGPLCAQGPGASSTPASATSTLAPGFRVPFGHHHADQEEVYVVVAGSARIKVDDEIVELGPWDADPCARPDMTRGMQGGPDGAEILAFGAPSHENADVQMVQDFWPATRPRRACRARRGPRRRASSARPWG